MDQTFLCHFGPGRGGNLNKTVQEFPYPKIVQGRPKENWLLLRFQIGILVKFGIDPMDQFQIVTQVPCMFGTYDILQFRALGVVIGYGFPYVLFAVPTEEVYISLIDVVYALEIV